MNVKMIHMLQSCVRRPPSGMYLNSSRHDMRRRWLDAVTRRQEDKRQAARGRAHVAQDPLVERGVPLPPEALERKVVVHATLHVLPSVPE
jgi:hypothetical protein